MAEFDWNSGMGQAVQGFMRQMMGMKTPMKPTGAGLPPSSPATPPRPLLGSLSSSYFKKPQAGLSAPPVAGPPQASLVDTGAASWAARYGVKPKWSKG